MIAEESARRHRQSFDAHRPARHQALRRPAASSSPLSGAACRPSSIPASISCMSTTWPRGICWRSKRGASARAIFSAARMRRWRKCLASSRRSWAGARRACASRARRSYPLAYLAEAAARLSGKEPFITVDGLRMSKYKMFFSSAKAERELGYRARPFALAIADAIAWFRRRAISMTIATPGSLCARRLDLSSRRPRHVLARARARRRRRTRLRNLALGHGDRARARRGRDDRAIHRELARAGLSGCLPHRPRRRSEHGRNGGIARALDATDASPWSAARAARMDRQALGGEAGHRAPAGGLPDYLWLTDADIVHTPDNLRALVSRGAATISFSFR